MQGADDDPTGHVAEGSRAKDRSRIRELSGPDDRGWWMDRSMRGG